MDDLIAYSGTFNWHGQVFSLGTTAKTEARAKTNMLYQLAQEVDRPLGIVRKVFNGSCDNYEVREAV